MRAREKRKAMREALAGILAEMRDCANEDSCPRWADGGNCIDCPIGSAGTDCPFDKFADRIEAAALLSKPGESDNKRATVDTGENIGNAAAMRSALTSVQNWCVNVGCSAPYQVTIEGLFFIINKALAAPPRNCDVGTAEEQAKRFMSYCDSKVCKRRVCASHGYETLFHHKCFAIWAQMPYEAKEGGAE